MERRKLIDHIPFLSACSSSLAAMRNLVGKGGLIREMKRTTNCAARGVNGSGKMEKEWKCQKWPFVYSLLLLIMITVTRPPAASVVANYAFVLCCYYCAHLSAANNLKRRFAMLFKLILLISVRLHGFPKVHFKRIHIILAYDVFTSIPKGRST
ncbi:hypothetical protein niasHT_031608 [Heterodera trifolii]|uniref:Uncharacterized protein n=1 Tax=Heterodera trifolii TaxID=157864 RepID=A0ABD2J6V1_9BILA